jgi:lipopolysaccharide/colanic/teichoic acid biosynthesis glycosyltransferase/glycosyltransferase involved in cell wall biosynthesis
MHPCNTDGLSVSVIVPAHNAAATLPDCMTSLCLQTRPPDEIIVVDDGSTDDTAAIARAHGAVVVATRRKSGPATARNLGVMTAHGTIVAFTDADCAPVPDWLEHLLHPFLESSNSPRPVVGVKGTYLTRQRSLVARFVQQEYEYKYGHMARLTEIDFIDTYSAAYYRKVFLDNGGFETAFSKPSVEDQELSFRLARKGYRLVFAPHAKVYHQHDQSLGEYWKRKYGIGYWKSFMLRWLPEKTLSDAHTPASQRWQILLLGMLGFMSGLGFAWPYAWALAVCCLVLFFATSAPFLGRVRRRDPHVLIVAPLMLLCRSVALGIGLATEPLFPPKGKPGSYGGLSMFERVTKRIMDVTGAAVGLVLSAPVIALAAVAIKLDSPGPVFFIQERAAENGKPFRMIKLRTMVCGAQRPLLEAFASCRGKPVNDPRITRVGRILRRWSLDELPQFCNVLRGEMSLVGPRPEETQVVACYSDWQRQRLLMKPGMTGPMQVSGRGNLDLDTRVMVELDYIEQYSLLKDIAILMRTVKAVITGVGAY